MNKKFYLFCLMYFMVRLRDFRWKRAKISALNFGAKYYLVGRKIILIAIYSIFLQAANSLFRPHESSLHRTSNFSHKLLPWYGGQDQSHPCFIIHWKLTWIRIAFISELISLYTAQNTSFQITLKSTINTVMGLHPSLMKKCF